MNRSVQLLKLESNGWKIGKLKTILLFFFTHNSLSPPYRCSYDSRRTTCRRGDGGRLEPRCLVPVLDLHSPAIWPRRSFFASGNVERELLAKQVALDITEDEKHQLESIMEKENREVFCPIVGCGTCLSSLDEFEDHYNTRHSASCSVCLRVYPTSRLLSIHISEAHDSFFQAKVARGYEVFECLVEGCDLKFKNYKSRQQHLVDKHKFPSSFEFFKKARPSKKQRHKIQHKAAKNKKDEASSNMEVENEAIDGLVSAVSRLTTSDSSPSTVSFGRRHTRGLTFVPRAIQHEKRSDAKNSEPMS